MQASGDAHRPCVICHDAAAVERYCALDALDYVRCRRCDLVFVDRLAGALDMRSAYTGSWTRALRRRLMARFRQLRHHRHFGASMERARRIFEFAAKYARRRPSDIRLLDIGCNRGFLLAAAIEQGADIYGIELVREITVPFCNTYPRFGDHIYTEPLASVAPRLTPGLFDLITAIDVVEHLEDPVADMRRIHHLLRDDGVMVIQTPDTGCEQARRSGCAWGALKPLEHLYLFDRANFASFADALGFRALHVGEPFEHADGNFVAVLEKK